MLVDIIAQLNEVKNNLYMLQDVHDDSLLGDLAWDIQSIVEYINELYAEIERLQRKIDEDIANILY